MQQSIFGEMDSHDDKPICMSGIGCTPDVRFLNRCKRKRTAMYYAARYRARLMFLSILVAFLLVVPLATVVAHVNDEALSKRMLQAEETSQSPYPSAPTRFFENTTLSPVKPPVSRPITSVVPTIRTSASRLPSESPLVLTSGMIAF
jgi:hypothetical protein